MEGPSFTVNRDQKTKDQTYSDCKISSGEASDCNRPGLAYGGAGEAWPIGRRLLERGLGRPRPAYRLGLKIYREKNGLVTKRNTRIRRKTGSFSRKSPNGCWVEPHRVGRGAFVVTGGQTQPRFRLFLARFTPVRPIGRPVGPIGFIGQRNNGLGRLSRYSQSIYAGAGEGL